MLSTYYIMTTQLQKEKEHIRQFKSIICPTYGLEPQEDWGSGSKNKKQNNDADITARITDISKFNQIANIHDKKYKVNDTVTISLKTEGGNFTIANGGTSAGASLFKSMNLGDIAKQGFKTCRTEVKEIQQEIKTKCLELGIEHRWKEIGNKYKDDIKNIYVQWLYMLFHVPKYQKCLYDWLNSRQADLKCVGTNLFIPEKKVLPENPIIDIAGDNTVIVHDFKLRLKSSGGEIKSSWKINYETNY